MPDCVPYYGGHCHLPSSPAWGSAYPTLAWWVYEYVLRLIPLGMMMKLTKRGDHSALVMMLMRLMKRDDHS